MNGKELTMGLLATGVCAVMFGAALFVPHEFTAISAGAGGAEDAKVETLADYAALAGEASILPGGDNATLADGSGTEDGGMTLRSRSTFVNVTETTRNRTRSECVVYATGTATYFEVDYTVSKQAEEENLNLSVAARCYIGEEGIYFRLDRFVYAYSSHPFVMDRAVGKWVNFTESTTAFLSVEELLEPVYTAIGTFDLTGGLAAQEGLFRKDESLYTLREEGASMFVSAIASLQGCSVSYDSETASVTAEIDLYDAYRPKTTVDVVNDHGGNEFSVKSELWAEHIGNTVLSCPEELSELDGAEFLELLEQLTEVDENV